MKNIKFSISTLILFFSIITCPDIYTNPLAAIGADGIKIGAQTLADALMKAFPHIGEAAAQQLAAAMIQASPELGAQFAITMAPALKDAAASLHLEAAKEIAAAAQATAVVVGGAVVAWKVCNLGKDLVIYLFPSEQEKETHQLFKTKKEFRNCLIKNHGAPTNSSGRPTVCEENARMFAMFAGQHELEQMTKTFHSAYKMK